MSRHAGGLAHEVVSRRRIARLFFLAVPLAAIALAAPAAAAAVISDDHDPIDQIATTLAMGLESASFGPRRPGARPDLVRRHALPWTHRGDVQRSDRQRPGAFVPHRSVASLLRQGQRVPGPVAHRRRQSAPDLHRRRSDRPFRRGARLRRAEAERGRRPHGGQHRQPLLIDERDRRGTRPRPRRPRR